MLGIPLFLPVFQLGNVSILPTTSCAGAMSSRAAIVSAAAAGGSGTADHSVDDGGGATDARTGPNGARGAIEGARTTFHAAIAVDNAGSPVRFVGT